MKGRNWEAATLAALGALMALAYAFTNPPFEAPDEPGHVAYVNFVARTGRWPDLNKDSERVDMGHHHPLAYFLYAGALRLVEPDGQIDFHLLPRQNPIPRRFVDPRESFASATDLRAFLVLRGLGAVAMGLTIWLTYLAARLWSGRLGALLAASLVAFLPQFEFVCGAVSNDPWVALAGAGATYGALRWLRGKPHHWGWWAAAAVLVKKSAFVLLPVGLLAALLAPRRGRTGAWWAFLPAGLATALVLARNAVLYRDPSANAVEASLYAELVKPKTLFEPYFREEFPRVTANSFFGHFGWMSLELPGRLIALVALPWTVGLLACLVTAVLPKRRRIRRGVVLLAASFLLMVGGVLYYNLSYTQPQGRLLFPALSALAVLAGIGWASLARFLPKSLVWLVPLASAAAALAALALNLRAS